MFRLPTVVSLLLLALPKLAVSSPCVTFDANFNLLVFGLDGKDWNAGTQDSWTSGITLNAYPSPFHHIEEISVSPFDGANTTCYLSQFFNAVYVMNGDASKPSDVHIYDAAAKSWSTQSVDTGSFDPSSFNAILDHDTNVFYAVSKNELFFLDMGGLKSANSSALSWTDVGKTPYDASYQPVMALAQNHIHFLNVPNTPEGDANIFVIHFSYFQPEPQAYPLPDGSKIPATHGQTASFFQSEGVQQEFAFIPDDGSKTYVINVETNTTQALAGPSTKDPKATYAASITALIQLDSTGAVSFLPYKQGDASTNAQAAWTKVANVAAAAPPGASSGASPSGSGSGSTPAKTGTSSASGANPSSTGASQTTNDALSLTTRGVGLITMLAGVVGLVASLL
ncbi:hypothetical protein K474DRAFT_1684789 [Panus rudis PR-1116 ss-1]|nr:hypothetical protein K474DRAFT_1684789 [Panus rudis PR-1116 ss-1]